MFDIYLDKLEQLILVKIQHQVVNKVETIANDNERKLVRQFRLLEEILDLLGIVVVALPTDAFDFRELATATGCLNVFEVDILILAEIDNAAEVVIQSFETLELFE